MSFQSLFPWRIAFVGNIRFSNSCRTSLTWPLKKLFFCHLNSLWLVFVVHYFKNKYCLSKWQDLWNITVCHQNKVFKQQDSNTYYFLFSYRYFFLFHRIWKPTVLRVISQGHLMSWIMWTTMAKKCPSLVERGWELFTLVQQSS